MDTMMTLAMIYTQIKPIAEKSLEAYKLATNDMEKRPHHIFHLHYPVYFYNMLPIPIVIATGSVSMSEYYHIVYTVLCGIMVVKYLNSLVP